MFFKAVIIWLACLPCQSLSKQKAPNDLWKPELGANAFAPPLNNFANECRCDISLNHILSIGLDHCLSSSSSLMSDGFSD